MNCQETNFKEWKLVVQDIIRFLKADTAFMNTRPLRYCVLFDSYPPSLPYVARFHANRVLKLQDALLTSYHRNEVNWYYMFTLKRHVVSTLDLSCDFTGIHNPERDAWH